MLNHYFQAILDLILPEKCLLCNDFTKNQICENCFSEISPKPIILDGSVPVFSLYDYQDGIKHLLYALKFNKRYTLAVIFEALVRKSLTAYFCQQKNDLNLSDILPFSDIDYFVPVPISKNRQKKRGYNQVDCIFESVVTQNHFDYMPLVKRVIDTPSLFSLTSAERPAVLSDAFQLNCNPDTLYKKHVVLLDDIYTTGATINEIATLLKNEANCQVSAWVFSNVVIDL